MNFRILQIKDIARTDYAFRSYDANKFNIEDYEIRFESEVDSYSAETLSDLEICEYLYVIFNTNKPEDFNGHSLSVSDLIHLESDGTCRLYYCNSFGWEKIRECRAQVSLLNKLITLLKNYLEVHKMTIKEMLTNPEVVENIVEDITDIPEDAEVVYSVWAIGYDCCDSTTGIEYLLGEFKNPDEAVNYAEIVTILDIPSKFRLYQPSDLAYFSIEVETVVTDPDDEDGGTMNIGSIYSRDLWLDEE